MSRVGKKPILAKEGTKVLVQDNLVSVEGPKGKLQQRLHPLIQVQVENGKVLVARTGESKQQRALHGLFRSLVANMVTGVEQGFQKVLEINGVGYKAQVQGKDLVLNLGYSHPVHYPIPEGIEIVAEKNVRIIVKGIDKQKVGQVAANIRSFRKPEPYKGKGIKYENEHIRRKVGKTGK
jgi:large subunit ribosomal protein L6